MKKIEKKHTTGLALKKLQEAWTTFSLWFDPPEDQDDCAEADAYRELEEAIQEVLNGK